MRVGKWLWGVGMLGVVSCSDGGGSDITVGSVQISSDRPLVVVTQNLTPPSGTSLAGSTPAIGGSTPALGGSTPGLGGGTAANTPTVPSLGAIDATGTATVAQNIVEAFNFTVSLVFSGFVSANPDCALFTPYNDLTCSASGFTLSSSDLTGTSGIRVNLTETGAFGSSNILSVQRLTVSQLSNTSGSLFADDEIQALIEFGNALYFLGRNANSRLKWFKLSDGVITQHTDTRGDQNADDYDLMDLLKPVPAGSYLYFLSKNSNGAYKLFKTDGTTVTQVSNTVNDQSTNDGIGEMAALGSTLFFVANNSNGASKIFKTDGTTVTQVSNTINDNSTDEIPTPTVPVPLVAFDGAIYFVAKNSNNVAKIFKTDGTTVTQVSNTINDNSATDNPDLLLVYDDSLYFIAERSAGVLKVFKTDGTTVTQVSDTRGNQTVSDTPAFLTVCNDLLFFRSLNSNGALKVFKYDGTTVSQVSNLFENQASSDSITFMKCSGDQLALYGKGPDGGRKLFVTDGTDVTLVSNTRENLAQHDEIADFISYGDGLYFVAKNASSLTKFYAYLGGQVYQVADINSGQNDSDAFAGIGASGAGKFLAVFDNKLYFTAEVGGDPDLGKLYTLCDSEEGC